MLPTFFYLVYVAKMIISFIFNPIFTVILIFGRPIAYVSPVVGNKYPLGERKQTVRHFYQQLIVLIKCLVSIIYQETDLRNAPAIHYG